MFVGASMALFNTYGGTFLIEISRPSRHAVVRKAALFPGAERSNGFSMELTFLGTRDEIDARSRQHRMHTSLMVSDHGADVMIDYGLDFGQTRAATVARAMIKVCQRDQKNSKWRQEPPWPPSAEK